MESRAYAPGHITGFVEFPIRIGDPLILGSRGAGVCIDHGILTHIILEPSNKNHVNIYINNKLEDDAEVSKYVISYYLMNTSKKFNIEVRHYSSIPIGYGLGSSGAAALSLSLALNNLLNLFDNLKAAQVAHIADLECKCGMGTVIAEYYGGLELRLKAGAPGIGYVKQLQFNDNYKVVILPLNPISTKEFLTNKISLINGIGGKMLKELEENPTIDEFLRLSFLFARSIKFGDKRSYDIIEELRANGYYSSLAMFGESIFTIVKNDEINDVCSILTKYGKPIITNINKDGAKVIDT